MDFALSTRNGTRPSGQVLKPIWYFSLLLVVGGLLFFSFPGA
jgi:hypothetical protein